MGEPSFRSATTGDAAAITVLERAANLAGLGHIFPAEEYPYPTGARLTHWQLLLADPTMTVEVIDGHPGLECVTAYDADTLHHLAVRPDHWGTGLGRAGAERAVAAIRGGGGVPRLWCLRENTRARRLYERLGWEATGAEKESRWPPYPMEMEYVLTEGRDG